MKIGYARVSTQDQNHELQIDALKKAGCDQLYQDKISGAKANKPQLEEALTFLRPGDTLVVWKLDRLGRTVRGLLDLMGDLQERGIQFESLTDKIDTSTPMGQFCFHVMAAMAQMERDLIRERTMAGLEAARARGRHGGRKRLLTDDRKVRMVLAMHADKKNSIDDICETFRISKSTMYRYIRLHGQRSR